MWRVKKINKYLSYPPYAGTASVGAVVTMVVFMVVFWCVLLKAYWAVKGAEWWAVILLLLASAGILMSLLVILAHEQNTSFLTFQVSLLHVVYC